jgi:hypothetical protein
MLSSISWQQYLAAVVILTVSYYGYVFLRYYQSEIASFFNRKDRSSDLLPVAHSKPSVMGEAKLADNVTIANSEELYFGSADPDDIEVTSEHITESVEAISPESELVQEADRLIEAFKDIDDKPQFLTLLKILVDSYKRFAADIDITAALATIIEISKEKLMFSVAPNDLQGI